MLLNDTGLLTYKTHSFQTYTSCLIMLHSAAQKQLHNFPPAALEDDLVGIHDVLGVLRFCSSSDRVAAQFLQQLTSMFNEVLVNQSGIRASLYGGEPADFDSQSVASFSSLDEGLETKDLGDFGYILTMPPFGNPAQVDLCLSLLETIGRPFADPSKARQAFARQTKSRPASSASSSEPLEQQQQEAMGTPLEWNPKSSVRFRWDPGLMDPAMAAVPNEATGGIEMQGTWPPEYFERFVGSTKPSGWAEATQPRCW